ncbi:MAG: ATP-binding cassette domain-containing protein [Tannerella sp.]|jgi:ABC-type branched-subunit amino acid transport system ATPase component|nr:ATP-binding cassette domain-containing protein [Tannerella sp.]
MKLELKNITGGYTSGHQILQGVNLTVESGQAVGIIGLNGSGKSTFTKAVMNTLPFRQGKIFIDDTDVSEQTTTELCHRGISLFLQGGVVFDELSVMENLHFAAKAKTDIAEILSFFNFENTFLRKNADKLSGGQRHQLALAMCLLRQPELLILDEPSAGLSPQAVEETYRILQNLRERRNLTIALIEQNVNKAVQFCDEVNLLRNGVITFTTTNKNLKKIENIMFNN